MTTRKSSAPSGARSPSTRTPTPASTSSSRTRRSRRSSPLVVENGWFEFDLTGTRAEFEGLRGALEESGRDYELLSPVGTDDDEQLLTDRQRRALQTGVREGDFDVPRECTLADLAATLDVDKSTASRVLRRATSRVTAWYVTSDDHANHPTDG